MTDLWPDFTEEPPGKNPPPVEILRMQAEALATKTSGRVQGLVREEDPSFVDPETDEYGTIERDGFYFDFFIKAPKLPSYLYRLFSIEYGVTYYPIRLHLDGDVARELRHNMGSVAVDTEEEFLDVLKRIFSARKTSQVIRAIFAHVPREKPADTADSDISF